MQASQHLWNEATGWNAHEGGAAADLVVYFGSRRLLDDGRRFGELRERFPAAHLVGCSTGGQIAGSDVRDDVICALAMAFESTTIAVAQAVIADVGGSRAGGAELGSALKRDGLAGVFVLSDGLHVNGSALVEGLAAELGARVPVSGGLAGDGADFARTLVGCDAAPSPNTVAAVGFYGDAIRLGHGSAGGWDVFGPMRRITKSVGNVLFEVDGKPALDLYKLYLGPDESRNLPGSALLFPMRIFDPRHPAQSVVRTILGVDHETGSMTFAGDMPSGWSAQLMRGSISRLCDGAARATQQAMEELGPDGSETSAAILVSCIGRRLLMGQRIEEEIEAVETALPAACVPVGFYSYGEITPHEETGSSQLHNQTMTVTAVSERVR
jgi:hypothetical protein